MKFSHLFKALCITALLSPTAFYAMELTPNNAKKIELGAVDNKTSSRIRVEKISSSANNVYNQSPFDQILHNRSQSPQEIKEILPRTMTDIMTPLEFEASPQVNLLESKYKILNDTNNELFAKIILDKQQNSLKGSLTTPGSQKPIAETAINLTTLQKPRVYVILRLIGDNYEKSKIEFSPERPKLEVEKKSRASGTNPVPMFYIPGFFRWTPGN